MPALVGVVLLSLVTYRVTRFVLEDSLLDEWRVRFHEIVLGETLPTPTWRRKVYELSTCPYCLSVWVAGGATALTDAVASVPLPVWTWLAVAAGSLIVWRIVEVD